MIYNSKEQKEAIIILLDFFKNISTLDILMGNEYKITTLKGTGHININYNDINIYLFSDYFDIFFDNIRNYKNLKSILFNITKNDKKIRSNFYKTFGNNYNLSLSDININKNNLENIKENILMFIKIKDEINEIDINLL